MHRRLLLCLFLGFASPGFAEEPAIEALLKEASLIVVAEPVFENGIPPIGRSSEITLVKYSIRFRIRKILKSDSTLKAGDAILTRLALLLEQPEETTFNPQEGKPMILFLRKTSYEPDSFENSSIWFGVQTYTPLREHLLGQAIRASSPTDHANDSNTKEER